MKLGQKVRMVESYGTFKEGDIVKCYSAEKNVFHTFKNDEGHIFCLSEIQYEIIQDSKQDQVTKLMVDFKEKLENIMAEPEIKKPVRKIQEGEWVLVFGKDGLTGLFKAVKKDWDGDWRTENNLLITYGDDCSRRYFIPPLGVWTKEWEPGMEPKTPVEFYNNTPLAFSTLEEAEKHCVEVEG